MGPPMGGPHVADCAYLRGLCARSVLSRVGTQEFLKCEISSTSCNFQGGGQKKRVLAKRGMASTKQRVGSGVTTLIGVCVPTRSMCPVRAILLGRVGLSLAGFSSVGDG